MKKIFAFVVFTALIISASLSMFSASALSLQVDHYKYMNIYENGEVRPDQGITRGELANAVFNLLEADDKKVYVVTKDPFSDVSKDYIYAKQISYLTYKGHFTGYEDGTFRPENTLTRAEFATIIKRFKRLIETTNTLRAPDIEGHWAAGSINAVIIKGYMKGYPDGTFLPDRKLTRAEVAKTLNSIFDRKPDFKTVIKDSALVTEIQAGRVFPIVIEQMFPDLPKTHWAFDAMMEACVSHRVYWDRIGNREVWTRLLDVLTYMPN